MIDVLKVQFSDVVKIKYDRTSEGSTETHLVSYEDTPHPDLNGAWRKLKNSICDVYGFEKSESAIPETGEVVEDRRYTLEQLHIGKGKRDGQIKFQLALHIQGVDDPFQIKSKWVNDIPLDELDGVLSELEMFVTGKKRAQSDMFMGSMSVN